MSDLTREGAIDEIKRWTPILLNSGQCTEKTSKAQDMAISALMDGWIPITKDMELPDHEVICCNNEEDVTLGYLYFDEEENQVACDHEPYVILGVVAYMEKPKPYKKEVNE